MSGSAPMVGPPDGSFAEGAFAHQQSGVLESIDLAQSPTPRALRAYSQASSELGVLAQPEGGAPVLLPQEEKLSPDVLNQKYGIPGNLTFTDPLTEGSAASIYASHIDQIKQRDIEQRAPPGFVSGATRFGAQFAAGFLDPLQLGAAMVPVVPEFELGASVGARLATAGLRGAAAGTAGNLPLVGLQAAMSRSEYSDYTAYDALFDLAHGAALGSGIEILGAGGGAFGRALSQRYRASRAGPAAEADPGIAPSALKTGLGQMEQDNPVEVRPVYDQSNSPNVPEDYGEPVAAPAGVRAPLDESWVKDTADVSDALSRNPLPRGWEIGADPDSAGYNVYDENDNVVGHSPTSSMVDAFFAARRAADERAAPIRGRRTAFLAENEPKGLTQFLKEDFTVGREGDVNSERRAGGLKDAGGDLDAIIGGSKGRPGLINNESGSSLNEAATRAYEGGYFDHVPDENELLDAIAKDHSRTNPHDAIYSSRDQDAADDYRYARDHNVEVDKMSAETGISTEGQTPTQFWDQVADHLSQEESQAHIDRLGQEHDEAFGQAEQAAKEWATQPSEAVHGEVIGAGDLWRVPPEELEGMLADKQTSDHDKLVRALGSEEGAAEFNRLDRKRNSQDPERADQGAKEFDERFGKLTSEQERLIYGIGETDAQESDIQGVLRAHSERESEDPTEAAYEAARAMRSVSPQQILDVPTGRGSGAAQAAFVRLKNAHEDMSKAGVPKDQIGSRIEAALVQRGGWSAADAHEVVSGFTESLRLAAERPRALEGRQENPHSVEDLYRGVPHTLEEMEHEWRQAEAANPVLSGEGGGGQPGPSSPDQGAVQGGAGQVASAAESTGRTDPQERSQTLQSALRAAAGRKPPDPTSLAAERSLTEGKPDNLVKQAQQDIEDHTAFFQAADAAGQLTEDVRAELERINGLDKEASDLTAAARQAAACIARGMA